MAYEDEAKAKDDLIAQRCFCRSCDQANSSMASPSNAPLTRYRTGRRDIDYNERSSGSYEHQTRTDSDTDPSYGPAPPLIEYVGISIQTSGRGPNPYNQQNIRPGETLSKPAKEEISRIAPHFDRCVITHLAGIDVEYCHMLQRATSVHVVSIGPLMKRATLLTGLILAPDPSFRVGLRPSSQRSERQ